jgi:hypothetical protein
MSVREDLKVTVRVPAENFHQFRVHERLAAQNSEKRIAHFLGITNDSIHRFELNPLLLGRYVHPAALTAQIATVNNGNVEEWWEELTMLQPPLMFLNRAHAFPAHIPDKLPHKSLIGFKQEAFGKSKVH